MLRVVCCTPVVLAGLLGCLLAAPEAPAPLRFEVTVAAGLLKKPTDGRLLIVLSQGRIREPRFSIGDTSSDAPVCLGADAPAFAPGKKAAVEPTSATYPLARLADLPPGEYVVQAVFDWSRDIRLPNAPGNLFSKPRRMNLDPARGGTVSLELAEAIPAETLPADTAGVRYHKFPSALLSRFHGREMFLRVGVLLPNGFDREPNRRYPLRVHIGGFGTRYTAVQRMRLPADAPPFVTLQLDGAGPFGDPYQVNSANHGPYGDALTQELIPFIEKTYRCIGQPHARVLDGSSTGGWVSLALQVFYPGFFNGAWSHCPDPVDFRAFELIDIYGDANAFVNGYRHDRPSSRTLDGDVRTTVRSETQVERVMGFGDRWELSGLDWASWNATFGPRGPDGRPVPLWDGKTGAINKEVATHWRKYDLRLILEKNWATLAPKLQGKLNIWVGEADDYFLNNAVHLLDDFLNQPHAPKLDRRIVFGAGRKGHGWRGQTTREMLQEMGERVQRTAPPQN